MVSRGRPILEPSASSILARSRPPRPCRRGGDVVGSRWVSVVHHIIGAAAFARTPPPSILAVRERRFPGTRSIEQSVSEIRLIARAITAGDPSICLTVPGVLESSSAAAAPARTRATATRGTRQRRTKEVDEKICETRDWALAVRHIIEVSEGTSVQPICGPSGMKRTTISGTIASGARKLYRSMTCGETMWRFTPSSTR